MDWIQDNDMEHHVMRRRRFMEMELWMDKNLDVLQNGPWERVYQTSDIGGWRARGRQSS
jgi:hypothetical protein